jgi:NAD(P)H-flavin reductase
MNRVLNKTFLSENVFMLDVEAPLIARNRKPGHFVIVKLGEKGERIPLTIAGSDNASGSIKLIIQKLGVTTAKLSTLNIGDMITDVVGPLGNATHIEKVGTVLCAGGGVGIAPLLPIVEGFKNVGNRVISVIAARNKDLLILEKEIRACSDEVIIMSDDGSVGKKGLVTLGMEEVIQREKVDLSVVIGPAIMMKFASLTTKKYNIKTFASLNTIMVDGTGMCGACRISVGNKTKFVCVDGPEFDAHEVNFDEMLQRLAAYKDEEIKAFERYQKQADHECRAEAKLKS